MIDANLDGTEKIEGHPNEKERTLAHLLNTQSRKVILTYEIFLFADIRENKISGLPERRAKILRGRGLGPRNGHISTNTKRNDKVTF